MADDSPDKTMVVRNLAICAALAMALLIPSACSKGEERKVEQKATAPIKEGTKPKVRRRRLPRRKRNPLRKRARRIPVVPEQITNRDPNSLLGGERGFDHVGIAVKDLAEAKKIYTERLGFGSAQPGRLPNGLKNVNLYFGDTTYIELLTVYDRKLNPWVASFIDKHQAGAMFMVLCAYAYQESKAFLAKRGYPVGDAKKGSIRAAGFENWGKNPMWHTFYFKDTSPLPGDPKSLFFIAYNRRLRNFILSKIKDEALRRRTFKHPNTALGLKAAWVAVPNLAEAVKGMAKLGLKAGPQLKLDALGAVGREVKAGQGSFLLVQPRLRNKGPVAAFLRRRTGIIGVTVLVEDLEKARGVVQRGLKKKLGSRKGPFGRGFVVPPNHTKGVWLEFVAAK